MLQRILSLPGVRQVYARRFERAFAGAWVGAFRGVYGSFAEALRSAPATKPIGYDHDGGAMMYGDRFDTVQPADYPVMFWLEHALRAGARSIFDLGGHVGLLYYGYRKYLKYPDGLRWTVMDVPQVVALGAQLAARNGVSENLKFVDSALDASGSDVLLASGSLQYLDSVTLDGLLSKLPHKPRWLVVNKTPLSDGESFVTLQNIGTAFCPYRVFNASAFISAVEAQGYELVDRWSNADCSCELPLTPTRSVKWYSGLLFRDQSADSQLLHGEAQLR